MLLLFALACQNPDVPAPVVDSAPFETADTNPVLSDASSLTRLSHTQWHNTTVDLLLLTDAEDPTGSFVKGSKTAWFDNARDDLVVDPTLWLQYQAATEKLARTVALDPSQLAKVAPVRDRNTFVAEFGARAFRRPLTGVERSAYAKLFDEGPEIFGTGDAFVDGAHAVMAGMMQSPSFLYRTSGVAGLRDDGTINDYELASKLSYGLWNTMPDPKLIAAAEAGFTKASIAEQTRRMLDHPRAEAMIRDLHRQWLHIDSYQNISRSKDERYDDYVNSTPYAMEIEVHDYIDRIVFGDGTIEDMYSSRDTIVEYRLADIYGITDVDSEDHVPVTLDPNERAGLLTLSGFLSWRADGDTPDLIGRGGFVNEAVLCVSVPPPPPGAAALPVDDDPDMTMRERIEEHTEGCGGACHNDYINPIGFSFGIYDETGAYQTTDKGQPIDAAGTYPMDDGLVDFVDAVELSEILAVHPQSHSCYISHLLAYTSARGVVGEDHDQIEELTARSLGGQPILELIYDIVTDDAFRQPPITR